MLLDLAGNPYNAVSLENLAVAAHLFY